MPHLYGRQPLAMHVSACKLAYYNSLQKMAWWVRGKGRSRRRGFTGSRSAQAQHTSTAVATDKNGTEPCNSVLALLCMASRIWYKCLSMHNWVCAIDGSLTFINLKIPLVFAVAVQGHQTLHANSCRICQGFDNFSQDSNICSCPVGDWRRGQFEKCPQLRLGMPAQCCR